MEFKMATKFKNTTRGAICALLALVQIAHAETPVAVAFDGAATWESKYVSEGRNNLPEGGISTISVGAAWQGMSARVWYAAAQSESYDELQGIIEYRFGVGPVETYASYTRLEFLDDGLSDNEFVAGVVFGNILNIVPAAEYKYSTEAEGGYLEVSLRSEFNTAHGRLRLEPYVLEGFDFGYASAGHDGPNNFRLGVDFAWALTDRTSLVGSVAHSWAHQDVKNEQLGDESWVTIGFAAEF